jgi:hypothetical protein
MNNDLLLFVREGLKQGLTKDKLNKALREANWPKEDVAAALDYFADIDFPIPVPKRKPYLSAREAFLYLVMFLTLYMFTIAVGTILFQFVNRWLPDVLVDPYFYDSTVQTIRAATAALLTTFPIFLFVNRILEKGIQKDPEKRSSKIRKWLTYLTLFVTAGVIIGNLITLLNGLLAGELTLRFLLKVLIVFVIAGAGFGYYLWNLRQDEKETK